MMKRKASSSNLEYQSPPQCGFKKEVEYTQRELDESLSGSQQQQVLSDLYGSEEVIEETPQFLKEVLENLSAELESYSENKDIITKVKSCIPSPLDNDDLMLKFLRAEKYSPKLAARRTIKHFEKKLDLFGVEKLGKQITLDDLGHEDLETLRSGGFQPIPSFDSGGRVILFERFQNIRYKDERNLFRVIWYISMVLVEEYDAGRGLVVVSFQNGPFSPDLFDRNVYKQTINLIKSIPAKLVGYHFCFDDIRYRMVWGLATVFIGKEARLTARDHEGTPLECTYDLMSYGIPVEDLPVTVDGMAEDESFLNWIEERRRIEKDREGS
jgi:hypothetical protein